jgi:hypothetical protein
LRELRETISTRRDDHARQTLAAALKATRDFCEQESVDRSAKVNERRRLQTFYVAVPETSLELVSLRRDVANWLDSCTLADLNSELAALITERQQARTKEDYGRAALRTNAWLDQGVLCSENALKFERRRAAARDVVRLLKSPLPFTDMVMTQAIAAYLRKGQDTQAIEYFE